MIKFLMLIGTVLMVGGLLFHFAALETFNALVPKDAGVARVARDVQYGSDPRQRYDIYRPEVQGPLPLLVFVYGGSWASGDKGPYEFAARAFAAKGYVVVVPDYRLVPQNVYPDFVDDVALAIAAAQRDGARFGADTSRTYLVGHSAGAYNLTQAVLKREVLVRAGVDKVAIKAVATLAGPFDFLPLDVKSTRAAFGHLSGDALRDTQPIHHARADAPPFLILHGETDTTVRLRSPHALEKALREAGGDVTLKTYPGVSHVRILLALAKPLRDDPPVLEDVVAFFARY
jgi:acetyl esterase/lipase